MLQVEEALKELYRSDSTDKNIILDFYRHGEKEAFLRLWDSGNIKSESMKITESLCSGKNLDFGSCEASQLELVLIDVEDNVKGATLTVYQTLEGLYPDPALYPGGDVCPSGYTMPLGTYVVQSANRKTDRRYRDVLALDLMSKFDVNVIDWYNALPFPMPLKDFRASLCRHIGVKEQVPDYLPNDTVPVEKTIDAAELTGRAVLTACEQLNGVFGHFDRNGVLRHITLQPNYTLLPAMDLYPSVDLYPSAPGEMNDQVYDERIPGDLQRTGACTFEEYTVQSVGRVQIRQEEGDIGAIYGDGGNCLTVEGNFLVYGKSAADLNSIAGGIYGMVSSRPYVPYSCELKGLPYLEVGDTELIEGQYGTINTYIIKRTLKGITALKDTHSAVGEEIRRTETNVNTEIIQLKGKAAILKKNVEEVSANLIDLEKNTEAMFKITAEEISAEVKRAKDAEAAIIVRADEISLTVKDLKNYTESQFIQTANQIALKVSKGDVSSQLSVETDKITLSSNRLIVNSTNFQLDGNGNATFSGRIVGGSININNGTFTVSNSGVVAINSGSISIGPFEVDNDEVWIGDYYISSDGTNVFRSGDGSIAIQTKRGGPLGSYAAFNVGNTELSDHHVESTTGWFGEIYIKGSWWDGWSLTRTMKDVYSRIRDLEDQI